VLISALTWWLEQGNGNDAVDGVSMLEVIFKTEMENLLAAMHQDMQLLIAVFLIVVSPAIHFFCLGG
jgi:hypothetical protein